MRTAYANAVPMGGDLRREAGAQAAVHSDRDARHPFGATPAHPDDQGLARCQWDGSIEKIFDVVCSDGGKVDAAHSALSRQRRDGRSERLASSRSDKGAGQLQSAWSDPEFDPRQHAFYYARVIENPTCRWSTWDAIRAQVAPNPKLPKTIQERAYTSPIWFVPTKNGD